MSVRITLDLFSGRPNPYIELDGDDAREALARMKPAAALSKKAAAGAEPSILGYRGLIVEQIGRPSKTLPRTFRAVGGSLIGEGLAHRSSDENLEALVLKHVEKIQGVKARRDFPKVLADMIETSRTLSAERPADVVPFPRAGCECAPIYEPNWWNDGGQIQNNNNCYNYAANYRTDTFAQPGRGTGQIYTSIACAPVRDASVRDALIDTPKDNNKCPKRGHLVALVIAPDFEGTGFPDFHWYRKGPTGRWSHKPGGGQVTNLDNSGKVILDPRTADRGSYTDFCTFMVVMHGHIKLA